MSIKYFNRETKQVETELVYGESMIYWLYQSAMGKLLSPIITSKFISQMYGLLQDLPSSKNKIKQFVSDYQINLEDFLPEDGRSPNDPYSSFNQFFIRKFRPEKRTFVPAVDKMAAFAEARYFALAVSSNETYINVKGINLLPKSLIQNAKWESSFENGPVLLARLCPVDYHRFHFPVDGVVLDEYRLHGDFHSVNPIALEAKKDILIENERHVTIIESDKFGKLAIIDVGAVCVGKIVQTYNQNQKNFKKGDEKGYFLFGGSTVVVVGQAGKWSPSLDLLQNTQNGLETYLKLGDEVAHLIS